MTDRPAHERGYLQPPESIVQILDAPPTPAVNLNPQRTAMLLVERENLPPVRDLARPMLRLAGLRIDPRARGPHRPRQFVGLSLLWLNGSAAPGAFEAQRIELPADANITNPRWSPDGSRFAFTRITNGGIELWCVHMADSRPRPLTGPLLNAVGDEPFRWMGDGRRLICRFVPQNMIKRPLPQRPAEPDGPVTQQSDGQAAPVRTFQDLLQDAHDEAVFEHLMMTQLAVVDTETGGRTDLGPPGMYSRFDVAPGGRYLLVSRVQRPFSYLVPLERFGMTVEVWDLETQEVRQIARIPLRETIPIEGVQTGPRGIRWRDDADATLVWTEALDEGDPRNKVPHRDRLMFLDAPFSAEPREVLRLEHRFSSLAWLEENPLGAALIAEYDRDRRWMRTWLYDEASKAGFRPVWDRSIQDRYSEPGAPLRNRNSRGRQVVRVREESIYLAGPGCSPEGDRPFLDRMNLRTMRTERLWQCQPGTYEQVIDLAGANGAAMITRFETPADPPNFYLRDPSGPRGGGRAAVTRFTDPAPPLRAIRKQLVTYQRADGVDLSATLYLPPGYRPGQRLPLLVWAYPREFNDPATAGQVAGSPHIFMAPPADDRRLHLLLLLAGYAVMDNATMPVVGDPETANDTFVEQIVASARAAIDKAVEMGVADRDRVAIGGHSYGGFMTANLMAHCDLFKAGIARSGAYNRTLTPFGFQGERRTFWEAPQTYINLSPFAHAHRIRRPLLLTHGRLDANAGTFPMQSERLYHAIKGNGGRARLVLMPFEDHHFQARESVLHLMAEMLRWLDEHVKGCDTTPRGSESKH